MFRRIPRVRVKLAPRVWVLCEGCGAVVRPERIGVIYGTTRCVDCIAWHRA